MKKRTGSCFIKRSFGPLPVKMLWEFRQDRAVCWFSISTYFEQTLMFLIMFEMQVLILVSLGK